MYTSLSNKPNKITIYIIWNKSKIYIYIYIKFKGRESTWLPTDTHLVKNDLSVINKFFVFGREKCFESWFRVMTSLCSLPRGMLSSTLTSGGDTASIYRRVCLVAVATRDVTFTAQHPQQSERVKKTSFKITTFSSIYARCPISDI
jgi:hypothetical protein